MGDYARGGKNQDRRQRSSDQGMGSRSARQGETSPFGILMVVAGALTLLFGSRETSDAWADALQMWWQHVRAFYGRIQRLVIYLDNGPKNWGRRTQFLKRMVQFADWSGWSYAWCTTRPTTASSIRSNAAGRPWRRNGTV